MTAPAEILELVDRFRRNIDVYKRDDYKETRVRVEFIDPFFQALGWDVYNEQGYAEQYKDVVHEDAVKVGGKTRAPDYSFRVGGIRKFFLEAKKPSVSIKSDIGPAYQLRRYAWSAKLPLSILTDFEEFAVYDCRQKPKPSDSANVGRILYLTYEDYPERWEEIHGIFAKESVLKGSFDRYVQETKSKRGTGEVDAEFLKEIEQWRNALAQNIALRNPTLTVEELNFAVQRTIDRVIFLRIAEDRGIERYGRLMTLRNGANIYARLRDLYRQADERYNSGLFDFKADTLTPQLIIDDKVLKTIIKDLYYPESPYEFSVLPADVLGQVYEQFLGKVIRLTPGHRAKVEEKPEVRKAGGVYYTPTFIVEYIVERTVGTLVEGKSPKQITALKILDPACGSGSFLLGAYQYLLDAHLAWYLNHEPERYARARRPAIFRDSRGQWRLTTAEKKRILLNNIHGVDIDRQAVEVTKLSLLLKVLEDENQETLGQQLSFWKERALPNLNANIKCGNSLIGPDYFDDQLLPAEEEIRRVNPFDWKEEFPNIMAAGGFDVVIGNPPYVRQEMFAYRKDYLQRKYQTYHGSADLYVYFIERGVSLLKKNGLFCYIVANKWLRANYGKPFREWLRHQCIEEITDFEDLPVFQQATTYPCILRIQRNSPNETFPATKIKTLNFSHLMDYVDSNCYIVNQNMLDSGIWSLADQQAQSLLGKLREKGMPLENYVEGKMYRGILTGLNQAFIVSAETRNILIKEDPKSEEILKPFVMGRDIKRYEPLKKKRFLIFTRRGINIKDYPAIEKHLYQFKESLTPKPKGWKGTKWQGRKSGSYKWYEIQDTIEYHTKFEKPKIIIPSIIKKASFTYDKNGFYSNDKTTIIATDSFYLLGLLNSKLLDFVMHAIASTKRGGYFEYKPMYLAQLPIRAINFNDPEDVARHDKMVALVRRMLDLHKRLANATLPDDKTLLQRQIDTTDRQIDTLVYELYGLTEKEIGIVERNTNSI